MDNITTQQLPAFLASYYVNGDASSLTEEEIRQADQLLDILGIEEVISDAQPETFEGDHESYCESYFVWGWGSRFHGVFECQGGNVMDFYVRTA